MPFFMLIGIVACGLGPGPEAGESRLHIQTPFFKGVEHRFLASEGHNLVKPENVAIVRGLCPRIVEATYRRDEGSVGKLQLVGEHLEKIETLSVQDGSGRFLESVAHREADDTVRFALQCTSCRLVPGFRFGGRVVGCLGPGYSLRLVDGELRLD